MKERLVCVENKKMWNGILYKKYVLNHQVIATYTIDNPNYTLIYLNQLSNLELTQDVKVICKKDKKYYN